MEKLKDVTAGHRPDRENNYCTGCHASIFRDNRMSDRARRYIDPVRDAERRMRYNLVNRLNFILYNHPAEIMFPFIREMTVFFRGAPGKVSGVVCRHDTKTVGREGEGRSLRAIIDRNGERYEADVLDYFSLDEIIKLYEMIFRALFPREDNPDLSIRKYSK